MTTAWFAAAPDIDGCREFPNEDTARRWTDGESKRLLEKRKSERATYWAIEWPPVLPGWSKCEEEEAS